MPFLEGEGRIFILQIFFQTDAQFLARDNLMISAVFSLLNTAQLMSQLFHNLYCHLF